MGRKGRLNCEMIWKIWKKDQMKSENIIWKKSRLNSGKIWQIQKKSILNGENISKK
jgi:hypothetical protein